MQTTIQDLFQVTKQQWLEEARDTARKLLQTRPHITIEDVLKITPLPNYLHRNTIGAVFKDRGFRAVGWVAAHKSTSNGRAIRQWSLR